MFSHPRTSALAQRALGALELARAILLLEDDYDVDWEVDEDASGSGSHPHRVPLRSRRRARRPGAPAPGEQVCVSPVEGGRARQHGQRQEGIWTSGSA